MRRQSPRLLDIASRFQFTHPGKGATSIDTSLRVMHPEFQFTHPGKGATGPRPLRFSAYHVSIHAPWEGCDFFCGRKPPLPPKFQFTHPGKGATASCSHSRWWLKFQFTHPGKGATGEVVCWHIGIARFNSRTLGRVRQCGAKLRIIGRINKRNLRLGVLS